MVIRNVAKSNVDFFLSALKQIDFYHLLLTLRKKCPYLELFWSTFSRILTEYGISPYSVLMRGNVNENNSEYGRFSRRAKLN